jgi:signal transduction histidine kinase
MLPVIPNYYGLPLQLNKGLNVGALCVIDQQPEVKVDLNLAVKKLDKVLVITVSDSGIGLSGEAIRAILDGTSCTTDGTSGEGGYGFGLALVKHLVESLNGNLQISSESGEGAVFTIRLPQH